MKEGKIAPALRVAHGVLARRVVVVTAVLMPFVVVLVFKSAYVPDRPARSAIEATIVVSLLTTLVLLYRRFSESRKLRDVVLFSALVAVTTVEAWFLALLAWGGSAPVASHTGARLGCALLVPGALAAAAFMSDRRVAGSPRRVIIKASVAAVVVVAVPQLIQTLVGLPGIDVDRTPVLPMADLSLGTGTHIVACLMLLVAAVGWARRWTRGRPEAAALAAVCELLAAATMLDLLAPRMTEASVGSPDVLRLFAALIILAVAVGASGRGRQEIERRAIAAERARLARDLHDGIAQDLALIASHSGKLAAEYGSDHPLTVAARRALDASRGAIVDLAATSAVNTLTAVRTVCRELERRYGIEIEVRQAEPGSGTTDDFDAGDREDITRIAREAIINAVKHGHARHVTLEVGSPSSDQLLRVWDNGRGLGAGSGEGTGLGVQLMGARASSLGGDTVLRTAGDGGTELLVLRT